MNYDCLLDANIVIVSILALAYIFIGICALAMMSERELKWNAFLGAGALALAVFGTGICTDHFYYKALNSDTLNYRFKIALEQNLDNEFSAAYYQGDDEFRAKIDAAIKTVNEDLGKVGVAYGYGLDSSKARKFALLSDSMNIKVFFIPVVITLLSAILIGILITLWDFLQKRTVESDCAAVKKEMEQLDGEILEKTRALEDKETAIRGKKEDISDLNASISDKLNEISTKEQEIKQLEARVQKLSDDIESLQKDMDDKKGSEEYKKYLEYTKKVDEMLRIIEYVNPEYVKDNKTVSEYKEMLKGQ